MSKSYFQPTGFLFGDMATRAVQEGKAVALGKYRAFTMMQCFERDGGDVTVSLLSRGDFPSLSWIKDEDFYTPRLMGILNVTPDSFSDGGQFFDVQKAVSHGQELLKQGVDILDIGGESTRPGAAPISVQEEMDRVLPVIEALSPIKKNTRLSIDTRHADTMSEAIRAGADWINDVSALTGDTNSMRVVATQNVPVILMHMRGRPQTMQQGISYHHTVLDIYDYLETRLEACVAAGLKKSNLMIDPGIGFGKTVQDNVNLLRHFSLFHTLGVPIVLGVSRKSFIGHLTHLTDPSDRLPGSLAAALSAVQQGVQILRVHDVKETAQAIKVFQLISGEFVLNKSPL